MNKTILILSLVACQAFAGSTVKNFRELYESLLTSIGMEKSDNVNKAFTKVKEQLPQWGLISEVNSSSLMATMALGSTACEELILSDSKLGSEKRWIHKQIDFSKDGKQLLSAPGNSVFEEYANIFWQRSLTPFEQTHFTQMTAELNSQSSDLKDTLLQLCTVVVSSPDFYIL